MILNNQYLPLFFNRRGLYYGWIILIVSTLGVIMSIPGQTMGVSVYTDSLLGSLGISRVQLSFAYMFGTLGSACLLPFAGRILDKIGARWMGSFACACLAIFLFLLAFCSEITAFVSSLLPFKQKYLAILVAFFCFLGIRHFGQGQLTMCSRTMLGLWFEKNRGFVFAISGVFIAFGFGIAPLFLTALIDFFEWQNSLFFLSSLVLMMGVVACVFFRHSPEHSGLKVDGGLLKKVIEGQDEEDFIPEKESFTVEEARSTLTFWVFTLGLVAHSSLLTAVTFHLGDIGKLAGIGTSEVFKIFLPVGLISVVVELASGYLSDRISLKYLLAFMQIGLAVGLLGLNYIDTTQGFAIAALGMGISNGLFSLLNGAAWPKLFGRKHLGSISGLVASALVAGSAVGPYVFSLGNDYAGNYKTIIFCGAIFPSLVFILSYFADAPKQKLEN